MANNKEKIQPILFEVSRVPFSCHSFGKLTQNYGLYKLKPNFAIPLANHITADTTKYNYVVGASESEILTSVTDFINNSPAENKYIELKNQ